MQKIFKYPFECSPYQDITMPEGGHILSLQTQRNTPCLWAMIDPEKPLVSRRLLTFGTGHEVVAPEDSVRLDFLGTYQVESGQFIFHVFEVIK